MIGGVFLGRAKPVKTVWSHACQRPPVWLHLTWTTWRCTACGKAYRLVPDGYGNGRYWDRFERYDSGPIR